MNSLETKTHNNGQWTNARFNSFIKSALRTASLKWPPRFSVLNKAKRGKSLNKKSGRLAEHYICNACRKLFPGREIQVNHIIPVVPLTGFTNWSDVIDRLFCEEDGLEVLCLDCHKAVTAKEKEERKTNARV